MVGQRDGGSAVLGGPAAEPVDSASAVQKRVFGMNVKMNELIQSLTSLT